MHGIKLEDILVKNNHTLSVPYTYLTVDGKMQDELAHRNWNHTHVSECILGILHFTQVVWHLS